MSARDDELAEIVRRWRDAWHVIDENGKTVENPNLGAVARNLMAEVEQLLDRPAHRPRDAPQAFTDRLRRAICAELLYLNQLPSDDVPPDREDDVRGAAGNRDRAGALAAEITHSSARQIQRARRQSRTPEGKWQLASEPGHQVRELGTANLLQIWQATKIAKK